MESLMKSLMERYTHKMRKNVLSRKSLLMEFSGEVWGEGLLKYFAAEFPIDSEFEISFPATRTKNSPLVFSRQTYISCYSTCIIYYLSPISIWHHGYFII